jgi:PAS domain S-box-containing protein
MSRDSKHLSSARDPATALGPATSSDDALAVTELYRLLVESVTDYAIFVLDPNGVVRSWNPGAQRLKGYTEDEIVGKHFSVFYPADRIAERWPEHELNEAARVGRFEDEGWRVRKDGSLFWANVVITALRNAKGDLVGYAKVTRDLTARKHTEEQARLLAAERAARGVAERLSQELTELNDKLQQQAIELESQTEEAQSLTEELEQVNEQLQQQVEAVETARGEAEAANRAKTDFLAVMSHELRTPLNAIAGYAELLRMGLRGPVTPEQLDDLDRIARSERALLALVNNILNYVRIEAGQLHYARERVPVRALITDLEALVSPQLGAKQLRLGFGECDERLAVQADSDKVRQILVNLLSNAIKFTPTGGSVHLECEKADGVVLMRVRDNGVGIPPEKLQVIFEPFVQLDRNLTNITEGSGLGLAISRDLARGMGGDLTAENTLASGATFTLSLPHAE